jgi:hypothetical protein
MKEYLELGTTPSEEDCVQVDPNKDYYSKMVEECRKYIKLLEERFPNIPESCRFGIKRFSHDFGSYCEAVIYYDDSIEESVEFAFNVEGNLPERW